MRSHKGVYVWSSVERIGGTAITFTGNVILARLLTPGDFGLLAMVGIFVSIAYNISSCGMSDGLIRKLNPTKGDYSTVFVFNACMGLLFGATFIMASRPIAAFFQQSELVGIMWAIGVCFFFQSLSFVQETKMRKELEMKKIAIVKLSSTLCAVGLGIVLALNGMGYWALVSSRIFLSFFIFVFYLIASRWLPRIAFYRDSFKEMFGYGVHLMLTYIITQVGRNVNVFVLGRYSPAASGVYSQAQKMQEVPYGITEAVFDWPFFPVLANEGDENKRRVLAQNMFKNIVFINVAMGLLLLLLSRPGFNVLFGAKWADAIPIFRVLLIFGVCSAVKFFMQTILKAYSRTKTIRNISLLEVSLQLGLLACFYHSGIMMIALSQVMAVAITVCIYVMLYMRIEEITPFSVVKSAIQSVTIPVIVFAIVAACYYFWNGNVPDAVNCVLIVVSYMVFFVCGCEIMKPAIYVEYRNKIVNKIRRVG